MDDFTRFFSGWLKSERKKSGYSLLSFSQLVDLSEAQVSRIESGLSTITLFSMVKILYALKKSYPIAPSLNFPEEYVRSPSLYDTAANRKFSALHSLDFVTLLQNQSCSELNCPDIRTVYFNLVDGFCAAWSERYGIDKKHQQFEGIRNELLNSKDIEPAPYPEDIENFSIEENYRAGGVVCMRDLTTYIRNARLEKGLSLSKLGAMVDLSHPTLSRLEKRMGPRVLFTDLLKLDDALDLHGNLIALAWRAAEFYTGTRIPSNYLKAFIRPSKPWGAAQIEQFENIIYITRFFQHYFPDDRRWYASFYHDVRGIPYENILNAWKERDDPRTGRRKNIG